MAFASDVLLPKQQPSPLAPQPTAKKQSSAPSHGYMPPMIADSAVQDSVNNQMAAAAGAGRAALLSQGGRGMSFGRGQQRVADMAEASADSQARAGAATTEAGAAAANAQARNAYDKTMRGEQLGNSGLLENLRNAKSMEGITKQGWQQDLYEAMRRGQFGLDSIYLDTSPLLDSLLKS